MEFIGGGDAGDELEIVKSDASDVSDLYSATIFDNLNLKPEFIKAIKVMGYNKPSKIQGMVLPLLLENPPVNMMAQSQSGTGKTAAFLLAALMRIDPNEHYPQVLVLLPTLELAKQVSTTCRDILKFFPSITILDAVRGAFLPRGSKIKDHVVIGTPGKTHDWAIKYKYFDIKKLKVFVLDEADIMISEGHHDISIKLHRNIDESKCQILMFSATFNEDIIDFADVIIKEPFVKITLKKEDLSLMNIKQVYLVTNGEEEKLHALQCIYESLTVVQAMVFCATRRSASEITKKLQTLDQSAAVLSAELDVHGRQEVINKFRAGHIRVLVTTNVCARGIDIQQVSLVVNYDLPKLRSGEPDYETYLHRVGRTGRFGRYGLAINFVDDGQPDDIAILEQIQQYFQIEIIKQDVDDLTSAE